MSETIELEDLLMIVATICLIEFVYCYLIGKTIKQIAIRLDGTLTL